MQYIPFKTREQVETAKNLILGNRPVEALTILESSLQIYDSHIANRMIGELYSNQQNFEKALSFYNKVYNQFKFDPEFLYQLALIYKGRGDKENAAKCLNEIKQVAPEYAQLESLNQLLSQ